MTSSVRGVPRAVKSSNKFLHNVWLTALASSLAMTVWQADKVFIKYYRIQTAKTMREIFQKKIFPWVTVCNVSPLPDDVDPNLSWKEYLRYLEAAKEMCVSAPQQLFNSYGFYSKQKNWQNV